MAVQDLIISKSTELFFNYGINSVRTEDIVALLGISKKTFYAHFESKEKLVEIIVQAQIEKLKRTLTDLRLQQYNAVLEAIKICELDLQYKRLRNENFTRDIEKSYPNVWSLYEDFASRYLEAILVENIQSGIKEAYYHSDLNLTITARLWITVSTLTSRKDVENEAIRRHFIRGLLTEKGISEYLFWE